MVAGQKKNETILYLVLWTVMYLAPMLSMYAEAAASPELSFDWDGVRGAWSLLTMFCAAFWIHNLIIAPLLVYRSRPWLYAALVAGLAAAFMCYQVNVRPPRPEDMPVPPELRGVEHRPPHMQHSPVPMHRPPHHKEPPRAFGGKDSVAFIIMALLLGLNVGAKYYFKSAGDRKRMQALERDNLNTQLEYLKYQINPHLFMNTLNNIHALVLIDPEQANVMIETLSRLMRYVLYDGNHAMASLQKEIEFMNNFIDLMRVRYTEKVKISVDFPTVVRDVQVPSLLFVTFIENAFKHGVSYESDSYVDVKVSVNDADVLFECRNSCHKFADHDREHGGVGLANARKRLDLIYGRDYRLSIEQSVSEYRVTLRLPVSSKYSKNPSEK